MAECKVPEELSDEKTREDIPEEYVCSGPETTLQFLVARARDEKDYDTFKKALSVSVDKDGIDINEQDKKGLTALHFAVCLQDLKCVSILISQGASANVKDNLGFTPLFYATGRYADVEIARCLLEKGKASVHAVSRTGVTALHGAALLGQAESVELLLKHGADPRSENEEHETPLDIASGDGTKKLLLKYGRKKDQARDKQGESCSYCGEESSCLKRCARCRVALYCSKDCQTKHWKEGGHKKDCAGFVLAVPQGDIGGFWSCISMQKRRIYSPSSDNKEGYAVLKNKQFIVKVQVPLGAREINSKLFFINMDATIDAINAKLDKLIN